MKYLQVAVLLIVTCCVMGASTFPTTDLLDDDAAQHQNLLPPEHRPLLRVRRVTCDVLSFTVGGFQFNHAACALHCLKLKKSGGHCKGGTCYCRK